MRQESVVLEEWDGVSVAAGSGSSPRSRWRRSAGQQRSKLEAVSGTANGPRWRRSAGQRRSKLDGNQRESNGARWGRSAEQQRSKVEAVSGTATVQGGGDQRDSNGPRWRRSAGQQWSKVESISGTATVQGGGGQRDSNGPSRGNTITGTADNDSIQFQHREPCFWVCRRFFESSHQGYQIMCRTLHLW
ncbi:uncharacterized protein LOC126890759 isoform X2 [Diabrotica virgifera virgifera]|uniref:Uncharacterized protein n=1 Tax=Diabrotica virgifera virgifera TaxID=50390 RepID=A0ABM5L0C3_DIAVI|nr:uncharacterized protein LOC126890759 isoform X2 [Diabrotica virgifera virgifera]